MPELDIILGGVPNERHCQITLDAAAARKQVVMEKPLCLNRAEEWNYGFKTTFTFNLNPCSSLAYENRQPNPAAIVDAP
jgi:hypothetical protein